MPADRLIRLAPALRRPPSAAFFLASRRRPVPAETSSSFRTKNRNELQLDERALPFALAMLPVRWMSVVYRVPARRTRKAYGLP